MLIKKNFTLSICCILKKEPSSSTKITECFDFIIFISSKSRQKAPNLIREQIRAIFKVTGEACILYRAVKEMITHEHTHFLFIGKINRIC